mmetsp:Transcript_51896/g.136388  ORF Transcript_51896/g.136388 Transcript_51896/m.136388 type:complete len:211 (-) Transcript_51896:614-1246(-)
MPKLKTPSRSTVQRPGCPQHIRCSFQQGSGPSLSSSTSSGQAHRWDPPLRGTALAFAFALHFCWLATRLRAAYASASVTALASGGAGAETSETINIVPLQPPPRGDEHVVDSSAADIVSSLADMSPAAADAAAATATCASGCCSSGAASADVGPQSVVGGTVAGAAALGGLRGGPELGGREWPPLPPPLPLGILTGPQIISAASFSCNFC